MSDRIKIYFPCFFQDQETGPMLSFKTLVDFINRNDYISLKNFLENRHCNVDDTDEDKNLTALMVAASQGIKRQVFQSAVVGIICPP